MSDFGDDAGADDAYDASGATLDPLALTIRFHEERMKAGDTDLGYWHTLDDDTKAVAQALGEGIAENLLRHQDVGETEKWLNEAREYLGGEVPGILDRRKERGQLEDLVDSLRREGTLR